MLDGRRRRSRAALAEEPSPGQFVHGALKLAERVPAGVIREEILKNRRTFQEVGEELFPDTHVKIAQMAVSHAARDVLTPEELEEVRERNRSSGGTKGALSFMPEGYVRNGSADPVEQKTKWPPEEVERLLMLCAMPAYQYNGGMHDGKPCFSMICHLLNEEFHGGERIRNANNCARKWLRLLRANTGDE